MAVFAAKCFLVFQCILLLLLNTEGVKRSKDGCLVCGKKSQQTGFRSGSAYVNDLENCFGVRLSASSTAAKDAEGLFKSIDTPDRPSSTLVLKPAFISTFTHLLCFIFIVRMSCSYMSLPLLYIQEANLFKENKHVLSRR